MKPRVFLGLASAAVLALGGIAPALPAASAEDAYPYDHAFDGPHWALVVKAQSICGDLVGSYETDEYFDCVTDSASSGRLPYAPVETYAYTCTDGRHPHDCASDISKQIVRGEAESRVDWPRCDSNPWFDGKRQHGDYAKMDGVWVPCDYDQVHHALLPEICAITDGRLVCQPQ